MSRCRRLGSLMLMDGELVMIPTIVNDRINGSMLNQFEAGAKLFQ
jgi:hypothetical protein